MLIGLTDAQLMLAGTVRQLMERSSPESEVRRLMATVDGHDPAAWRRLVDLGLVGLAVPEMMGGVGGTLSDQGVVLEEMGRALFCGPYFGTAVLAVQVLLHSGDTEAVADLLGGITSGRVLATLAIPEPMGRWDDAVIGTRAERDGDGWCLTGNTSHVVDGALADLLLVAARSTAGISLFAVEGGAVGMRRTALPTMDQTRKQATIELASTPARLIGEDGRGCRAVGPALQRAAIALAAEQVGGARRVLEMVVEYAKRREQFGRPIGSFQAVQHRCATMLVEVEAARSAAAYALSAASNGFDDVAVVSSIAKSFCSDTYRRVTDEAIQLLGGIAITWEHPIHLYFKRARSSEQLLGTPSHHRELLAEYLAL